MSRRAQLMLCTALLLAAGAAQAQDRTGRIEGTIYDDEGNPLAGAAVAVASPTQIGGALRATTDAQGGFRFPALIPGVFTVTVRKAGFVGAQRENVRVNVGRTVTLDILLDRAADAPVEEEVVEEVVVQPPPQRPSGEQPTTGPASRPAPTRRVIRRVIRRRPGKAQAETYVIKASRPVVDVTQSTTGENLSDEYLENMPLVGRSYQGVAGMTRGVTQERNPKGSGGGNPSIAGGAYFNNTYSVDGMETTDPVTHTFSTNFNFDAMADVNVMTGATGPEYSDTPGGIVNMVTKSGSNKLELDSSLYYQDDALTIKRPEEVGSDFSTLDFNLNAGGPLLRDKLWYFASFELNRSVSTVPPDENRLLPPHPPRTYLGIKALAKATWQLNPKHKLVAWFQTSPASISNTRNAVTVEPDAEAHQNQYNAIGTAAWEWIASDRLFVKTQLGVGWNGLRVFPESGNQLASAISDIGTGISQRNYGSITSDDRYRISLQGNATYFRNGLFGDHELRGGFRYQHLINPSTERVTGDEVLQNRFGQPAARTRYFLDFDELSSCDPTSASYDEAQCRQGTLSTTVRGNKAIVFLEDRWKLPRLTRLRLMPGVALHLGNTINPDGHEVTSMVAGTAHLNATLDVFNDRKTVLRAGYNQYVDMGFLSLARFIGRDLISYRCSWDEDAQSYSRDCRVGGQTRTVGVAQPTFDADGKIPEDQRFNPGALSVPRVHELTVGAEREWLDGFSTGIDFQFRRYDNQWEDLETNVIWNQVGDQADAFRNGKSEFIYDLETPDAAYRRYLGLSIFARRFVGNWQLMASYTWSRNEGTVAEGFATEFLDRARQVQFYDGFLPDDRRHVLKLTGFYSWRGMLIAGGNVWLGSGTPYDRLYYNGFFGDYSDRRAPRGTDPGDLTTPDDDEELRTPTRLVLDLKLTYRMQHLTRRWFGESHNLELIGEVFNVFNLRTPTSYEERNLAAGAATQWGEVLGRQNPFRVRFGLRYRY